MMPLEVVKTSLILVNRIKLQKNVFNKMGELMRNLILLTSAIFVFSFASNATEKESSIGIATYLPLDSQVDFEVDGTDYPNGQFSAADFSYAIKYNFAEFSVSESLSIGGQLELNQFSFWLASNSGSSTSFKLGHSGQALALYLRYNNLTALLHYLNSSTVGNGRFYGSGGDLSFELQYRLSAYPNLAFNLRTLNFFGEYPGDNEITATAYLGGLSYWF